jgi:DUF4097 and DUF4098 domain-containing protein YvlB
MSTLRSLASLLALGTTAALVAQVPAPPEPPEPPAPPAPPEPAFSGPSRTEKRLERLAFGAKLWVKNRNGGIKVTVWDKEEVALTALIRDTEKRKVDLILQRHGQDLDIEATFQQPSFSFNFGFTQSPRCEMTLQVPRKLAAHFRTVNGGVTMSGVEGYARVETTNGSVKLEEIKGEVMAETTNGSIEARRLNARIKGGTTNGKVLLEKVDGGIQMETTNGSITAHDLDGWGEGIRLETTNGRIDVDLGKATGELRAENTHGELDLKVPGAQLVSMEKHTAHLKIPGKTQTIRLETTNGGIRVR